ncbi:MAG TPA: AMP-binding protein, partial [Thermoanaerobaculia bacterium]|nr:AMP-binding protein [Thermoanaerobaculia bacterium]
MNGPTGIAALFEARAAENPRRPAWIGRDENLSYGELNARVRRIARALANAPGDPAAPAILVFSPGVTGIAAQIAAYRSGRVAIPMDPLQPADRLVRIARAVGTALVVTDAAAGGRSGAPATPAVAAAVAETAGGGILDVGGIPDVPIGDPAPEIDPGSPACVLFTSGSTGAPKGVVQSHGMIATQALAATEELSYVPEDRCLVTGSTTLGGGLSNVHQALVAGAAVVHFPVETEGFAELAAFVAESRVTVFHTVPSIFRRFLATAGPGARFPSVRLVRVSSDAVLRRDFDLFLAHFPEARSLRVNLALTEAGTICSHLLGRDAPVAEGAIPVGPPVPGVTIEIHDDDGRPVPSGTVGEIVVRREWLADGYWRDPALSAARFPVSPDGTRSCRTGDLGRLRPDGILEHVGRRDFQVKIRGVRVHLGEVEAALASVPGARDVAAVSFDEPSGEKMLVGYFEAEAGTVPPGPRIRELLRSRLPAPFIPRAFVVLRELPRTPNGKIDRRALPAPEIPDPAATESSPADETEGALLEIWRLALRRPVTGTHEDFFELGGDSLAAAEILAAIERRFGRRLPLPMLLDASTIAALARILREPSSGEEPLPRTLVALRATGSRPAFFCVPGGNGPGFNFRTIARLLGEEQPFYAFHVLTETGRALPDTIEAWAETFLADLRRVQPRGPYRLGGHSFGGTVAWEMARRLSAAGESVEILALFDTFAPGYPPPAPPARRAAGIARRFSALGWTRGIAAVRSRIARRLRPAPLGRALRAYAPPALPVPVVLFRARDQAVRAGRVHDDPDNGWRAIA